MNLLKLNNKMIPPIFDTDTQNINSDSYTNTEEAISSLKNQIVISRSIPSDYFDKLTTSTCIQFEEVSKSHSTYEDSKYLEFLSDNYIYTPSPKRKSYKVKVAKITSGHKPNIVL